VQERVTEVKLFVSRPATPPDVNTLILLCGDIMKPRSAPVQSILERKCGVELNHLELKCRIKIFESLRFPFSQRTTLSANVGTISSNSYKKVRTKEFFWFLISYTKPVNLGKS
jgi:hypothetical protein